VPTKSIWRKLARVAATHYQPVRFLAPESEYRTTKCCCACGAVTTPATMRLRRCASAQCTAPREAQAGAAAGGDGGVGGRRTARRRPHMETTHRFRNRRAHGRPMLPAAQKKASTDFGTATSTAPATCS